MRDSIILGTGYDIFEIWYSLNIVNNLNIINLAMFIDIALSAELDFNFKCLLLSI